ncbi:MAG TPA: hypothetical protein DCM67_05115 [Propionibacteriaceae bacterium]|nr:hypothetical protein [Propionibacteriaceae bacterium]
MLGKLAFEIPIARDGSGLDDGPVRNVFTTGGRMLNYAKDGLPVESQNTTISAIIVVERYPLGENRFSQYYDGLENTAGRKLSIEECYAEVVRCRGTDLDVSLTTVRCVVHENPFARMPLPRDLFVGPYDERYGSKGEGWIRRVFAGVEVAKFDVAET